MCRSVSVAWYLLTFKYRQYVGAEIPPAGAPAESNPAGGISAVRKNKYLFFSNNLSYYPPQTVRDSRTIYIPPPTETKNFPYDPATQKANQILAS